MQLILLAAGIMHGHHPKSMSVILVRGDSFVDIYLPGLLSLILPSGMSFLPSLPITSLNWHFRPSDPTSSPGSARPRMRTETP